MNEPPVPQPTDDSYAKANDALAWSLVAVVFFLGMIAGHFVWH